MTDKSKVERYYRAFSESARLDTDEGRLEFDLSLRQVEKYLQPGCRVLDLGGGPGRYTLELIEKGYQVFLADLSSELVEIARELLSDIEHQERILGVETLSALDLGHFKNKCFDAVVCFGPFYHLTMEAERKQAAQEVHRVLSAGGNLFASYIPRWTGITSMIKRAAQRPEQITSASFRNAFETGVFENQSMSGFQEGYFYHTEHVINVFESVGFTTIDTVAVQGLGSGIEEELYKIKADNPELFEVIVDCIQKSADNNAVLEFGGHCIYTGKKS